MMMMMQWSSGSGDAAGTGRNEGDGVPVGVKGRPFLSRHIQKGAYSYRQ